MSIEALVRRLVMDVAPVRIVRPPGVRLSRWMCCSAVVLAVGAAMLGLRADFFQRVSDPGFLLAGITLAVAAVLGARSALVMSIPGAERSRAGRLPPIVAAAGWPVLFGSFEPAHSVAIAAPAGLCALLIVCLASVPAWVLWRLVREGAACEPEWAAAMALIAAGSGAALLLQLHCPTSSRGHLLSEHVAAVALLAAAGAIVAASRRRRRTQGL